MKTLLISVACLFLLSGCETTNNPSAGYANQPSNTSAANHQNSDPNVMAAKMLSPMM